MVLRAGEAYFNWLKKQIRVAPNPRSNRERTYNNLLFALHDKEFVWTVPNDDNRVQDGLELRVEFFGGAGHELQTSVSVLEVLIGLSRRVAFVAEGNAKDWAWQLIVNLGLDKMCDPLSVRKMAQIDEILEGLVWRQYERNGNGGFFPLAYPVEDQTKVELWYQMHAFLNEQLYGQ